MRFSSGQKLPFVIAVLLLLQTVDQIFTESLEKRFSKHSPHAYSTAEFRPSSTKTKSDSWARAYGNAEIDMKSDRLVKALVLPGSHAAQSRTMKSRRQAKISTASTPIDIGNKNVFHTDRRCCTNAI
jgi:hypothetical protein